MKRIKAKNFNEFFSSHMGKVAWRRANSMFEAAGLNDQFVDGQYRMRIMSAGFEVPKRGWPQVIFEFEFMDPLYQGRPLKKVFQVHDPSSLFALLRDYTTLKLNFNPSNSDTIKACNELLTRKKPECIVLLTTNLQGFQIVKIERLADWATTEAWAPSIMEGRAPLVIDPKTVAKALKPEKVVEVEPEPESPPEPILEPSEPTTKEAEVVPGMKISYKFGNSTSTGLIIGEHAGTNGSEDKVLVLDDVSGEEVMVKASNVLAILPVATD